MLDKESILKDFKNAAKNEAKQRRKAELALDIKPFRGDRWNQGVSIEECDTSESCNELHMKLHRHYTSVIKSEIFKIMADISSPSGYLAQHFKLPVEQPVIVNNKLSELIHFYSRGLNPTGKRFPMPMPLFDRIVKINPKIDNSGCCELKKHHARYKWSWKLNKAVRV
ncbi:coil containing protein [Vibrio phage 1.090.B._10N.286.48.F1]|nr:coil containing protein [Vibrio phage 1.090.B._10N.286.48.F1]